MAISCLLVLIVAVGTGCPMPPKGEGGKKDVSATDVVDLDDAEDLGDVQPRDTRSDIATTDVSSDGTHSDASGNPREIQLPSLETVETNGFATSKDCVACHSNEEGANAMRDSQGRPVGFYDLWHASMMANSARDPLWRAMVSAEVKKSPGAAAKIQNKCMRCHTPMAYKATRRQGNSRISLDVFTEGTALSQIALDGVSCAACHQIEPDNLGKPSSFTGGFEMTKKKTAFGPYDDVFAEPMKNRNGFTPTKGTHIRDSGLCGSCHTLYTNPIDAQGNSTASGHFPEQTPFLEWRNSQYSTNMNGPEESCQSCHEPTEDRDGNAIETQIARNKFGGDYPLMKVPKRSAYGRHLFVGGNTLIPAILRDNREALNPPASDEAFDALLERVRRQLENRTATIQITRAEKTGGALEVDVGIDVMTGHKFPTGYPARRAWLHVKVTDGNDRVVFQSGRVDMAGRIVDGRGEPLDFETVGGPIEPHHETVEKEDDVQIYQSIMSNASGETTWRLMRASTYQKDNRLLPKGWSSNHPAMDDIEPIGTDGDMNFAGGGDEVTYRIAVPGNAGGPYDVEVELFYQPVSHRFARELFEVDTPAVRDFEFYWSHADRSPETIDRASTQIN